MIAAVDLFCGAGGTSTGLLAAAAELGRPVELTAINHWPTAIATHQLNHPSVRHVCGRLENIRPREVAPAGRLDLLVGSPECTHHSRAAGGRPKNDQSRCQAWLINHWLAELSVDAVMLENVREFQEWGPLLERPLRWRGRQFKAGQPDPRRKGDFFRAWLGSLAGLGYQVEYRVQNAADFGDAQARHRLIVLARRGGPVRWPSPSHGAQGKHPWRPVREAIDWSISSPSIFARKKPLAANTLRKIAKGLVRFGGKQAKPFLVRLCNSSSRGSEVLSVNQPLPTVTTCRGGEFALCEPFVIGQQSGAAPRSIDQPAPTVATAGAIALVQPFLVKYYGTGSVASIDEPLDTVTTRDRFLLVEPRTRATVAEFDIGYRMLKPHELAATFSFPTKYQFTGTQADQVRQIGNAVPVRLAQAHCLAALTQ